MKSALMVTVLCASMRCAWAQGALAVSGVYGVLDAGMVRQRCAACALRIDSGFASEARIGMRGSESPNDSMSALFMLEAGVLLDSGRAEQGGRLFGRQALVGLTGNGGMLTVGRQHNLDYLVLADVGDPFKGGMAGSAANLVGYGARRVDNSVHYYSAQLHGVSAAASYSVGAGAGAVPGAGAGGANARPLNRAWGISVGVERGPLMLRAAHQNRNRDAVTPSSAMGNQVEAKNTIVAANLRLGQGTAYAAYSANRGWGSSPLWNPDNPYGAAIASTASTDSRDMLVGVALPVGATTWLASFIRKNDRDLANRDADQIAIGATYALSQRTDFYAAYSRISNRNGAAYTVGNASAPGSGSAALNLGMRHAF
ncbi:MAG: porin [Massilia sp.]|nr:porin [Massilia sp.]